MTKRKTIFLLNNDNLVRYQIILTFILTALFTIFFHTYLSVEKQTELWKSKYENEYILELPSYKEDGSLLTEDEKNIIKSNLKLYLETSKYIKSSEFSDVEDIKNNIKNLSDLELDSSSINYPNFAAITFHYIDKQIYNKVADAILEINPDIKVMDYKDWLTSFYDLASTARRITLFIMAILIIVIIFALSFSIRARMTLLKDDIEIFHIMGAEDNLVASQFSLQSFQYSFMASFLGSIIGLLLSYGLENMFLKNIYENNYISFLKVENVFATITLIAIITLTSVLTTYFNAKNVLEKMP